MSLQKTSACTAQRLDVKMLNHRVLEADSAPQDYISGVIILEDRPLIAVTCWDGSVTIYEHDKVRGINLKERLLHDCALTSCCYVKVSNDYKLFVGSVQGEILEVDFESTKFYTVRNNKAELGISSICSYRGSIICGSWDGWIQVIDCATTEVVISHKLSDGLKVLTMDANENKLLVALTGNKMKWFKLPLQSFDGFEAESGLKYQARKVKLTPNGDGYVSSSLDGRVAVEYFDDDTRKFAFRCHRMNLVDASFVFPVNALAFGSVEAILYTGGSDGCVSCWNLNTRKKIDQFSKFDENSVVQLACNGTIMVVATSDDSFKTNATIYEDLKQLQPSRLYILYL